MTQTNKNRHGSIQVDQDRINEIEVRLRSEGAIATFQSKVDEEQLKSIYRQAKTSEGMRSDDIARTQLFANRVPKFVSLKIATITTILFVLTVVFIKSIETLWYFGQLAGVTISFLGAMLIPYLYLVLYKYLDRIFYLKGKSLRVTSIVYLCAIGLLILIGGVLVSLTSVDEPYVVIALMSVLHFTIVIWLSFRALK